MGQTSFINIFFETIIILKQNSKIIYYTSQRKYKFNVILMLMFGITYVYENAVHPGTDVLFKSLKLY